MPLYEYECENEGGKRFEVIQKFSDATLTTCPDCGGPVRRLISSPAIQFKGTGWYITDYARKGNNGGTPATGAKPAASGSTSESSSSSSSSSSSTPSSTPPSTKSPS
jgi:putative FmdB family regulatory protein